MGHSAVANDVYNRTGQLPKWLVMQINYYADIEIVLLY